LTVLRLQTNRRLSRSRTGKVAGTVLVNLGVFVLLFVLAEGLLSAVLLSSDVLGEDIVPERAHTRYDPELGWAPIPNIHLQDMYGPGVSLRTNSQGFRGTHDHNEAVPPGKRRIICSGDSVTFGYGVDDGNAWCRLLATIDPRLETINMGLPGYGVDQAYLWYKRDAGRFQHHVHLFAPITDNFRRMQSSKWLGYGRPFLVVEGGRLEVTNVPVPSDSYRLPWWTEVRRHLWSLRSAEALRRVRRLAQDFSNRGDAEGTMAARLDARADKDAANKDAPLVVSKILQDLKALNEARGSVLVVMHLPTLSDRGPDTAFWTGVLKAECDALGIPFLNLSAEFDRMPDHEIGRLFLPDLGHFTREGNEYVARLIHQRLARIPAVSRMLDAAGPRHGGNGRHASIPLAFE